MFPSMSRRFWSISPMPAPANISITGMPWARTSSSIGRSSRRPGAELLAELLPGGGAAGLGGDRLERAQPDGIPDARARQQELEEPLLGGLRGPLGHALGHLALDHVDARAR